MMLRDLAEFFTIHFLILMLKSGEISASGERYAITLENYDENADLFKRGRLHEDYVNKGIQPIPQEDWGRGIYRIESNSLLTRSSIFGDDDKYYYVEIDKRFLEIINSSFFEAHWV